jgi:hypothetical protein
MAATTGSLLLLVLTACGTSEAPPAAISAAPASLAASGVPGPPDIGAYRDCMATNGVTVPDMAQGPPPSGLPEGIDQTTFDAAQAACASLAPQGGPGSGAGSGTGPGDIDATALAAFASCLSDHDVTLASGADAIRQLDRTDPTVKAAMDACSALLPVPTRSP